jgi:hypothetical protein
MRVNNCWKFTSLIVAGAMVAGSLFAITPAAEQRESRAAADDRNFHAEASQLLKEIRSSAANLDREGSALESYTRGRLSWESHAKRLTTTKEHINTIGKHLNRLQTIRHEVLPWHQQAIDSILPSAAQVASSTQAAIVHLTENRHYLWAPEYLDHLKTIADHAGQLKKFVDLHLDLASTQDRLEELRSRSASIGS